MTLELVYRKPTSGKFRDLTGKKLENGVVVKFAGFRGQQPVWMCRCDCGRECEQYGNAIVALNRLACKCVPPGSWFITHGMSNSKIYRIWVRLKKRDVLCEEWLDFNAFRNAVGSPPNERSVLGRSNKSNKFGPGNWLWASSAGRLFVHDGKEMNLAGWARLLGISREAVRIRVANHPVEIALSKGKCRKGDLLNP